MAALGLTFAHSSWSTSKTRVLGPAPAQFEPANDREVLSEPKDVTLTDDPSILLEAIRDFRSKVGPEANRYLNIDVILQDQALAGLLRESIERSISSEYLPGFHFRDTKYFLWHLKNERHMLRYLLGDTIPAERFTNHWIRRFLVRNRYHYLSEVALALRASADSRSRLRHVLPDEERRNVPPVHWMGHMSDWLEILDCDRGYEVPQRNARSWGSCYKATPSKQSVINWANNASRYRAERQAATPYNGWYVDAVLYSGGHLHDTEAARSAYATIDTGYLEVWKWQASSSGNAPCTQRQSFVIPAAPDTWDSPDRKYRRTKKQ